MLIFELMLLGPIFEILETGDPPYFVSFTEIKLLC